MSTDESAGAVSRRRLLGATRSIDRSIGSETVMFCVSGVFCLVSRQEHLASHVSLLMLVPERCVCVCMSGGESRWVSTDAERGPGGGGPAVAVATACRCCTSTSSLRKAAPCNRFLVAVMGSSECFGGLPGATRQPSYRVTRNTNEKESIRLLCVALFGDCRQEKKRGADGAVYGRACRGREQHGAN